MFLEVGSNGHLSFVSTLLRSVAPTSSIPKACPSSRASVTRKSRVPFVLVLWVTSRELHSPPCICPLALGTMGFLHNPPTLAFASRKIPAVFTDSIVGGPRLTLPGMPNAKAIKAENRLENTTAPRAKVDMSVTYSGSERLSDYFESRLIEASEKTLDHN